MDRRSIRLLNFDKPRGETNMNPAKKLKILWAVDAFDDLNAIQEKEVKILQSFASRADIEVDPTYVLSPTELGVSVEFSIPWTEAYAPSAKKALAQRIKGVSIQGLREPQVLIQNQASLKGTVEVLTKFAANKSYDLIIAGSHGRKGLKRMMLGSFAEELLLHSEIPVLVVGSHAEEWNDKDMQILLPNDLADPHSPLFTEAFDIAQILGAKVTLLNSIPRPAEQVFQSGVYLLAGGWVPVPIYLEKERVRQQEVASKVLARAKKREIACDLIVDDTSPSVTDSILKNAREKKARFIVMAAESGPVASALLGSITRQIVRAAPCPVLVYRFKMDH
jgi:nucleotide-binding universal stress UspA family protein